MEKINDLHINAVIVDDDVSSVEVLAKGLDQYPWISVAATAQTCREAAQAVKRIKPELLFLDIELNDESALDIISELKDLSGGTMKIVFYTAFRKYLIQALRLEAFDFLLKPFDKEELDIILNRYRLAISGECNRLPVPFRSRDVTGIAKERTAAMTVTNITNDRIIVTADNILFFRYDTQRKLWEAVLTTMQRFVLKRNTTSETLLNYSNQFVRTHKSYIANLSYVGMISGNECRLIPPFDKFKGIKISKVYRRSLMERFYDI